jgi:membrane protease YdiL (CAAX protease family)
VTENDRETTDAYRGHNADSTRRQRTAEVAVFLFLIGSSMVFSLFAVPQERVGFTLAASAIITRDIALVALVVFFAWRNGEPLSRLGLTFHNRWKDVALGLALFGPMAFGTSLLENVLRHAGLSVPLRPPSFFIYHGSGDAVLALVLVVVVAISEETIFRGYLITRLTTATRSLGAAIILSAIIFSLGHGYEGSAGMVTVGVMGGVFALVYVWRKSLVAPMVMHFLQDFIGIVLIPVMHMR